MFQFGLGIHTNRADILAAGALDVLFPGCLDGLGTLNGQDAGQRQGLGNGYQCPYG